MYFNLWLMFYELEQEVEMGKRTRKNYVYNKKRNQMQDRCRNLKIHWMMHKFYLKTHKNGNNHREIKTFLFSLSFLLLFIGTIDWNIILLCCYFGRIWATFWADLSEFTVLRWDLWGTGCVKYWKYLYIEFQSKNLGFLDEILYFTSIFFNILELVTFFNSWPCIRPELLYKPSKNAPFHQPLPLIWSKLHKNWRLTYFDYPFSISKS